MSPRNFYPETRRTLTRILNLLLLVFCATPAAFAQAPGASAPSEDNPVEQVREARSWEMGPFVDWATGLAERSDFKFFSLGFQLGKPVSRVLHAGILSGQFELAGNIMPLWQAYTPAPHEQTFVYQGVTYTQPIGGGTYTGVSLTPVILRWNFLTRSKHIQPWFQGAGRAHLYNAQVPARCAGAAWHTGWNVGLEFFSPGRNRYALVHWPEAID